MRAVGLAVCHGTFCNRSRPWFMRMGLNFNSMKVNIQNNSVDCGHYTLEFATSLVNVINPEDEINSVQELRHVYENAFKLGR